jgi:taurine--2-oxoglutarate transaminase
MAVTTDNQTLTADQIVELAKRHTLFEWSAQNAVNPLLVTRAKGVHFWTADGKRYIDFNSQQMCVNAGHGDPRIVKAIQDQVATLAYTTPFMTTEVRARLGAKLAEICPGDIDVFFFTNGGAEANESAMKMARWVTGRLKILSFYRSYHGSTAGAMSATGDPRRWTEPSMPGMVHVLNPYHGVQRGWEPVADALAYLDEVVQLEGPSTIAGILVETVVGSNGVLIPPDGYLAGIRALCDRYGILMISDEVMSGFGRTGEWFAVKHWNVVPDVMTMAKGLTSAYVPMGAVGVRRSIADQFKDRPFASGLTYNSHPVACAAALAAIAPWTLSGIDRRASPWPRSAPRHWK